MVTRCEYLTARCPLGCEVWLHPRAVRAHTSRCPRKPWTDNRLPVTQVLLTGTDAEHARQICPPDTLHEPTFSQDRLLRPRPGMYLYDGMVNGIVVESPIPDITARRWWTTIRTADDQTHRGDAHDPEAFLNLEQTLGLADRFVRCPICGDDITAKRLKNHQRTNSVCRYLANTAEVRTFWNLGYRDPYQLRHDGTPTTWTELNSRVAWRNRLHIVRFRLWTAVLIAAPAGGTEARHHPSDR